MIAIKHKSTGAVILQFDEADEFQACRLDGAHIPQADLGLLNQALTAALQHSRLVRAKSGLTWGWEPNEQALDCMLWPIVRSAADLLTSRELDNVRQCGSLPCGWLFLDRTKNLSRHWCQMKACGNRAKSRRHYARRKRQQLSSG